MRRLKSAVAAAVMAITLAAPANAACRLALALGLDVSGSVDAREYDLQLSGLVTALSDPDVERAILATPDVPVALGIYEWSSSTYQRLIVDWRLVEDALTLEQIKAELLAWRRASSPEATGLGAAMAYGAAMIERAPDCWDQTLDISGDGKNNDWPLPERLRAAGHISDVRINALVIAPASSASQSRQDSGVAELSAYFQARIIQGPDAFIEVALGFDDYADAMRRKLLRELATLPLGSLPVTSPERTTLRP